MNQTDPIGDMLTRIRNGTMAKAEVVEMPFSTLKGAIARILKREGFIQDFTAEGGGARKMLRMYLKYGVNREPVIRGLRRISKPGLRRYISSRDMRSVLSGTGVAIVSTSRGIMTDREVRKYNVGGEWLCIVW
ncbi:MAG: 30S ribosomal protein S8 [Verrucomicrobia bacterium]|nr:30S ribosomal protein S8 [Verrucomicrobiota bacterium]MCG2679001.1 30S ribosomal protein S8 [Kiritimatiellia bacterium]MBU4248353.1 30S ribosomal protein S8 [Verrucomicrobiota bacterium]MBU4289738.1 30S ribosomal protein S8 [Verrucomicrobiota bacterium]MBU4428548.1 30S ribosomal protein S8 [Verrucomicrobiota bacterium]